MYSKNFGCVDLLVSSVLLNYSRPIIAFVSVISILIGAGVFNLQVSPDNRAFYAADYREYADLLEFEDDFEINSFVAFGVSSSETILDSAEFRSSLRWLERESPSLRNYVRSISIASLPQAVSENDELVVGNLLDVACPDVCISSAASLVGRSQNRGRLVSNDLRTVMLFVILDVDVELPTDVTETFDSIQTLIATFEGNFPDLIIHHTGAVPMMQAFVDTATKDSSTVVSLAFAVIFVLLALLLGSVKLAGLLFLTGSLAAAISLGMAGWLGMTLNTATAIVPIVVFTLVVAGAMHLLVHYLQRLDDGAIPSRKHLEASFNAQFLPMSFAAVTSILSLLSLQFVTSPPIKELGALSAVGVFAGYVLSFTFLGLLLPKFRISKRLVALRFIRGCLNGYAKRSEGKTRFAWLCLFAFILGSLGVSALKVDDDFVRYFDSDVPFRSNVESLIELGVGSPYQIEMVLSAQNAGEILAPEVLNYLREFEAEFRAHPQVLNVSTVSAVLEDVSIALDVPLSLSDKLAINQLFFAYELSLPPRQTSNAFLDPSRKKLRSSILLKAVTSNQTRKLEAEIYNFHSKHAPSDIAILVTGENIPVAHLSARNIEQSMKGLVPVLFIVAGVLALIAQRFGLFWVGLFSIAIPILAGFGIWGWLVGEIGLAAAIILAATVGVVIDDTIHIVYRFEDGRRYLGLTLEEAASYAVHKSGAAVVATSVCLSLGFLLMYFSAYAVNQVFGIIAFLIFLLAMFFTLIILPKLLVVGGKR